MSCEEQKIISRGSKSFYLASLFFGSEVKDSAWKLYRWCRYCDDQIDTATCKEAAITRLQELERQTRRALDPDLSNENLPPEFEALRFICSKHQIPARYPLDLLEGFKMDVEGKHYQTLNDVERYGYHVAGVVGLMMTHIFGISSVRAYQHAIDLGVAMQLTNIARDVSEDFALKRVYLPHEWLQQHGIPSTALLETANSEALYRFTQKLLARAETLYQSGYQGLQYLPLRSALAVSIAGSIYSSIGSKILKQRNPFRRAHVSLPEKLLLSISGLFRLAPLLLKRALNPWRPHEIQFRN